MCNQPSHSIWFCVWTIKWQCLELRWRTWNFPDYCCTYFLSWTWYSCSVHLRLLVRLLYFTWQSRHVCTCWFWKMFLKFPCYNDVCITHWGIYDHILVISGCTRKLHNFHQHGKKKISIVFKPSKKYFLFPGAPTPRSTKMLYTWWKIDNTYNAVAHMYCHHTHLYSTI